MKTLKQKAPFLKTLVGVIALSSLLIFSSCEQTVTVESSLHKDGSVDRTITFMNDDSTKRTKNVFGISKENGWETVVEEVVNKEPTSTPHDKKYNIAFTKHFASVGELNQEMDTASDTLFNIYSTHEEQFRWFYTYTRYADTYRKTNRLRDNSLREYVTPEDYTFIDRLPPEGKPITKADSLYLVKLEERLYDHYALRELYEEHFRMMITAAKNRNVGETWVENFTNNKERMFRILNTSKDRMPDDFMSAVMDTVKIEIPDAIKEDYLAAQKVFDRKLNFISTAQDTKFTHIIRMPSDIVKTNADSVSGAVAYWQPSKMKYLLRDYKMYAEARRLNYWAVAISGVIVMLTLYVVFRKRMV